ncbi:MAG: hypothetical protein HUU55_14425 [Myxococcales bacterium]|nr:hypothetical protein [Myxococcales bacterium]
MGKISINVLRVAAELHRLGGTYSMTRFVLCGVVSVLAWGGGCEPPADVVSQESSEESGQQSQTDITNNGAPGELLLDDLTPGSRNVEADRRHSGANGSKRATNSPILNENSPAVAVVPKMVYVEAAEAGQIGDSLVTIYNFGKGTLTLTDVQLETKSTDWALVDAPEAGFQLGHGEEISVTVRYVPSGVGPDSGQLVVVTDDPKTPIVSVPLTGKTGCYPDISLFVNGKKGNSLVFDGEVSDSQMLEVHNKGGCDLTVEKLYFEDDDLVIDSADGGLWAEVPTGSDDLLEIGLWEDEWAGQVTIPKGAKLPVVVHFRTSPNVVVQDTYLFVVLSADSVQTVPVGIPILFGQ